jgi:hypothetical protein
MFGRRRRAARSSGVAPHVGHRRELHLGHAIGHFEEDAYALDGAGITIETYGLSNPAEVGICATGSNKEMGT